MTRSAGSARVGAAVRRAAASLAVALLPFWLACSFDYGPGVAGSDGDPPDLVMTGLEYVRVRDGKRVLGFQADSAERFEQAETMRVKELKFEQYGPEGGEPDATGSAGSAVIDLATGDVRMEGGVRIAVPSEDMTMATDRLYWQDGSRYLSGGPGEPVLIERSDGTTVTGRDFSADVRARTWRFSGGASGVYVHVPEEQEPAPTETTEPAAPLSSEPSP